MKKRKFKKGDKVRIKKLVQGKGYGCFNCDDDRANNKMIGKTVTIRTSNNFYGEGYYYGIEEDREWNWSEEMFEIGDIQQIIE